MLVKTQAIVLRTLKYNDSQIIIDMFTECMGCVTFIQHIGKSKQRKIGLQFFQPLTILEILYDARQNIKLQRLKDVRITYPYISIPFDAYKVSISLFIADFLYYSVRNEQDCKVLYHYVETSIRWLDAANKDFANFHLVFMIHLTRFIGFYPNLENYHENDFFDLRNSIFTPAPPPHSDYIIPIEASKIVMFMRMNYDNMHLFKFSRHERNRCVHLILNYYRLHVPAFPDLKSLSVLQMLFE